MQRFLDVFAEQKIAVVLNGQSIWVARAKLGLHLQLAKLTEAFLEARLSKDGSRMASIIKAYLGLCGLKGGSGLEQMEAFFYLQVLNRWQWELPFMQDKIKGDVPPYSYRDRSWAVWIHKLASRYGWSRDQIFDLWPEEAACYMQEILVSDIQEYEEKRVLSQVSYKYDKNSKTSKYIDLPKPEWMQTKVIDLPVVRVRRRSLPLGNIEQSEDSPIKYH